MSCTCKAERLRKNRVKESTQKQVFCISSVPQSEGSFSSMNPEAEAPSSPLASLLQATGLEKLESLPEAVRSQQAVISSQAAASKSFLPGWEGLARGFS